MSPAYSEYQVTTVNIAPQGMRLDLNLSSPCKAYVIDIPQLSVLVHFQTADRLRVRIIDAERDRWEIPMSLLSDGTESSIFSDNLNYQFLYTTNPFGFSVTKKEDGDVLFNSSAHRMVYEDQYLEISSVLPSNPNLFA